MKMTSTHDLSFDQADTASACDTAPPTPTRRTVGRFRETPQIRLLRSAFGAMSAIAPGLTAHIGYRLLAKPPRASERRWQRELRERAHASGLNFAGGQIALYEWGNQTDPTVLVMAGYRVVSFDAPAHGASSGRQTDLIQFAGAVHAVAQHIGPIHTLMAHSFGVAMALFARRDWGVEAQRQVYFSCFDHCTWITNTFAQYVGVSATVVERMQQMMVDRHGGRFTWNQLSVVEMLRRTKQPTLLVHDQDDGEIPFQHSVVLHRVMPQSELHATSGLGHHRLLGNASVINRVVEFVSEKPEGHEL
jgi:pimeloyl-ACP methyl ester carboxylesterase